MKREYSCGAVLYTVDEGVRKYVLIMEPNGAYGFPKGHKRRTEDDIDCALREIKEETGIDATILPNFKRTIKYNVFGKSLKEVTYFVATYNNYYCHRNLYFFILINYYFSNTIVFVQRNTKWLK